nr:MAG TPA: antirepressor protein [Caudoviricetes sp.]
MDTSLAVLKQSELCGRQFTVYGTPEAPLFLAKDISTILEHSDTRKMVASVDEDEKLMGTLFLSGQNRQVWMLTEGGLYEVLMQSRKPIAKTFKKEVKEILCEIRTKGGYISIKEDDTPELIMARAVMVAQATISRHEEEIRRLKPKAEYTDRVLQSDNTYTMTQMAKELGFRSVGAFMVVLKNKRIAFKQSGQWMLYSNHSSRGYTKTKTSHFTHSDGRVGTNTYTTWTEKGRMFLHDIFDKEDEQ